MTKVVDRLAEVPGPAIDTLVKEIAGATDPQIMRIVGMVDTMIKRGRADRLIAPLRGRLRTLRPPRPLRFDRLLFHPLDPLIVPVARWRVGRQAIPRSALTPMANHVRRMIGQEVQAIEAEIAGRFTTDTQVIEQLGRRLWPRAAQVLANTRLFESWDRTGLADVIYRPLVNLVAALLEQAVPLELLCAETAGGLLPPRADALVAMLTKAADAPVTALPMLVALILTRIPSAAALIKQSHMGPKAAAIHAGFDRAADRLLRQLDDDAAIAGWTATNSLIGTSDAVRRIKTLLEDIGENVAMPRRREHLQSIRRRLDAACRVQFAAGLNRDLLGPLQNPRRPPAPESIPDLEDAARGLRALAIEARTVSSGGNYDLLLGEAADVIKSEAMRGRLAIADQVRLVEILAGPDMAMELLKRSGFSGA